jgi:acyl carrier protein
VLTADRPLDFFVLYSSAAALLGFAGQGNYAAANAFLDALAHHRRSRGLPGLSIAWGPFAEVGMAVASADRGQRLASRGVGSLQPAQGLAVLEHLLASPAVHLGVIPLDLRQWFEFYPSTTGAPFWSELAQAQRSAEPAQGSTSGLHETLRAAAPDERQGLIETYLCDVVAQVLGTEPRRIDRLKALGDMGLDSLMSLELRNRLETGLGEKLPATLLFTYPNVASLAEHVLARMALSDAPAAVEAEPSPAEELRQELVRDIGQMSEEEAERLLSESLDDLLGDI